MKKFSKHLALHLGVASAIAFVCAASMVFLYRHNNTGAGTMHEIKLTKTGFVPDTITITKGDTVVFTTDRGKPFWPASDLHPTHEIYPEFDPRQPIDPAKSWSFRFDKTGEWRFHDHLDPFFKGTVVVQDPSAMSTSLQTKIQTPQCAKDAALGDKTQCWQNALTQTLQQQGIDAAFKVFSNLYDAEPDFRQNCHGFTHILGQQAYQKFKNHEYLGVSSKTSYCGYGFYHGFMEALVHSRGEVADARAFCIYLNKQLTHQINVWAPCLHGIGHGTTDASDPTAWGNTEAMISSGLMLCEKVGIDEYEKDLCASGVFNSLANLYPDPKYRLSLQKDDPLAICRTQDKTYFKAACYEEMNTLLLSLTNNNFRRAAGFIEAMSEHKYQARAIDALASYAAHFVQEENPYDSSVRDCQMLLGELRAPCIAGLAAGFMEFGTPEKEYIQALAVCNSSLITAQEKTACFARALWVSSQHYSPQKQAAICASIEKPYRRYCPTESS